MANGLTIGWIALGSNVTSCIGGPAESVNAAMQRIESDSCEIFLRSRKFSTPAHPEGSGPDFVNAAIGVRTSMPPNIVLKHLHDIEEAMGRVREERWGPRVIDLDLLAYGDQVLPDLETHQMWRDLSLEEQMARAPDRLILPHPRLQERAFVLAPLADIAADWMHPVLNKSVQELLEARPEAEKTAIQPIEAGF